MQKKTVAPIYKNMRTCFQPSFPISSMLYPLLYICMPRLGRTICNSSTFKMWWRDYR